MLATRPEFGELLLQARLEALLTQEELAERSGVAARTISDLERGKAKAPRGDTVLRLADALKLSGPGRALFEAAARGREAPAVNGAARQPSGPIPESVSHLYRLPQAAAAGGGRRIGIVTGYLRRVRHVDIWVNSENTDMKMSRFEEYTISAIIRYDGARRDAAGHVIEDVIADELATAVAGRVPVAAGTAIMTGAGQLSVSHNVRAIAHVAAVYGEPGAGYRQVQDVGRCVTSVLAAVDRAPGTSRGASVLFPMLGAGQGRGSVPRTAAVLAGAAADYLCEAPETKVGTVWFLAHTYEELAAYTGALAGSPRFTAA